MSKKPHGKPAWLGQLAQSKWLLVLLALAFCARLYKVTNPVADWHAFRQADTASVTREYVKHGVDWLRPRYQDLSNIQSGKDNLEGYRMVEFPIVNALLAYVLRAFPFLSLVVVSRVASALVSLTTLVAIWVIARELAEPKVAWAAALVYAFLPYSLFYSRAILPEPYMLAASTWSIALFMIWIRTKAWRYYGGSLICLVLALLLKPFVLFLAPVFAMLAIIKWRFQIWKRWELVAFAGIAVLPMWWWRTWIEQFPSGIPANDWLFNGNGIRWRPAWFRWLGYERFTKLITSYFGPAVTALGLFQKSRPTLVYLSWWFSMALYMSVIATGNVQHDYYQVLLIPIISLTLGRGFVFIMEWLEKRWLLGQTQSLGIVAALAGLMWLLTWQEVKGYYNVNHWEYIKAGQAADRVLPADAKVIAPAFGDTQFLFQTNRIGWPIGFELDQKIEKGAQYYVATSDDDEARMVRQKYQTVEKGDGYEIMNLTQPK